MSDGNPYSPTTSTVTDIGEIQKVSVRPFDLFSRAMQLMGDQYWLFVGMLFVGILVGSAVPMGILMGPIMVGIYRCFLERESGRRPDFGMVFKGFDQFAEAFIAFLIVLAVSFLVMIPIGAMMFASIAVFAAAMEGSGAPGVAAFALFFGVMLLGILANVLVYVPFVFVFQLIADRKLSGMDAVKLGFRGVKKNLGGVTLFVVVNMVISMVAVVMCYIPAILFMPISFGALFLLYRDVFGPDLASVAQPVSHPPAH